MPGGGAQQRSCGGSEPATLEARPSPHLRGCISMKVEVDLVCDCRWWMAFGHTRSVDSLPVALPCVTVYPFSWNFPVLFSENSSCCSACFCWCSHQSWCSVAVTLILLHQRTAGIRMQLQSNASSLIIHNYETLMWQTIVLSPREMTLFSEWHSCFIILFGFFCFSLMHLEETAANNQH